jgi:hypothetical protein
MNEQLNLHEVLLCLDTVHKNPNGLYRLYDISADEKAKNDALSAKLILMERAGFIKYRSVPGVNGYKISIPTDIFLLLREALSAQQGLATPAPANPSSPSPNKECK